MKMSALVILCVLALVGTSIAQSSKAKRRAPEADSQAEKARQQWSVTPDPALPNVLILGDSISIGYTLQVRKLLEGKANVFRPLSADGKNAANCSGTTAGVKQLDGWLAGHKWAVIHFNWGLHDLKHVTEAGGDKISASPQDPPQATVQKYSENLEAIIKKLKATGARLIFATTTPVPDGCNNPFRDPADAPRYNAVALKVMKDHNVAVDDLFAFCEPQLAGLQLPKNVHFTDDGSKALAKQVAGTIEAELAAGAAKQGTDKE
jgi:lysophospholipase L1-like esterase